LKKKLNSVLLLDDNAATNFINRKFVRMAGCTEKIVDFQSGDTALEYLKMNKEVLPDLIFLDINMPIMNAWEFLEEFQNLIEKKEERPAVVLLSTSLSPIDRKSCPKLQRSMILG